MSRKRNGLIFHLNKAPWKEIPWHWTNGINKFIRSLLFSWSHLQCVCIYRLCFCDFLMMPLFLFLFLLFSSSPNLRLHPLYQGHLRFILHADTVQLNLSSSKLFYSTLFSVNVPFCKLEFYGLIVGLLVGSKIKYFNNWVANYVIFQSYSLIHSSKILFEEILSFLV